MYYSLAVSVSFIAGQKNFRLFYLSHSEHDLMGYIEAFRSPFRSKETR